MAGAASFAARSAAGVMARLSEPSSLAVATAAGDRGVILPVAGLMANCERKPLFSLVT